MQDLRFSNTPSPELTDAVALGLIQPRLWVPGGSYPGHREWREKAIEEVRDGSKRAMVAFVGRSPSGLIIYQRSKTVPDNLEIKNISVLPSARGRHIADFLLRQTELEGPIDFPGVTTIIGDTKLTNTAMMRFLSSRHYALLPPVILPSRYAHNGVADVVFTKELGPTQY